MKIAVIGLGYVGLPVALAFADKFPGTVGFDIHQVKVKELRRGDDRTGEVPAGVLRGSSLLITSDTEALRECTFFVVAVPTPIDKNRNPDLRPLLSAAETVGRALKKGDIVVFESTVYPGVTEEICGPVLARISGMRQGIDFKLAYSPERINPGDKEHTLSHIVKVVSGEDAETLDRVAAAYGVIIPAGIHRAPSIKVAEAAKVIENTQRDLNIALMNELAIIFDRMGIRSADVLAASRTKWNFLPFTPGLVGGHCIGVDPYYLTTKAQELGYHPEVILSGRRINDGMGAFVAQKLIKLLIQDGGRVKGAKIGILGLTFKEDVRDLRNSKVPDIVSELRQFGIEPLVHDPMADAEEARHEYGLDLRQLEAFQDLDALILAVPHRTYLEMGSGALADRVHPAGVVVDLKSVLDADLVRATHRYWSL